MYLRARISVSVRDEQVDLGQIGDVRKVFLADLRVICMDDDAPC